MPRDYDDPILIQNKLKEQSETFLDNLAERDSGGYLKNIKPLPMASPINYRYNEDNYLQEIKSYIDNTYSEHYKSKESDLQCIDVWFAADSAMTSCRDVVMKYLWRIGKKGSKEEFRKDVLKAIHYCFFLLFALDKEKN